MSQSGSGTVKSCNRVGLAILLSVMLKPSLQILPGPSRRLSVCEEGAGLAVECS